MMELLCHCTHRADIRCDEIHCDLAGPGEAGNPNQCRICYLRLGGDPAVRAAQSANIVLPEGPRLARKAWNYLHAIFHHVRRGAPIVSKKEAKERITICEACVGADGLFDPVRRSCKHPACGCNMDTKTALAAFKCPLGKWEEGTPVPAPLMKRLLAVLYPDRS